MGILSITTVCLVWLLCGFIVISFIVWVDAFNEWHTPTSFILCVLTWPIWLVVVILFSAPVFLYVLLDKLGIISSIENYLKWLSREDS
jgi:hypothetical protein